MRVDCVALLVAAAVATDPQPSSAAVVTDPSCNAARDFLCITNLVFCFHGGSYKCPEGTFCSNVFQERHPKMSPCILPLQSFGCDPVNKTCVFQTGMMNYTYCGEQCK
jgi:hypothetical protein